MLIASGGTAGYCAIAKLPDSKYDLRYIQAWLNHPYTEKLFQIMGSDFEGGFIARGTYLLKKIPFVELDFDDEKQKALYESVLTSTKKINELNIVLEQKKEYDIRWTNKNPYPGILFTMRKRLCIRIPKLSDRTAKLSLLKMRTRFTK